MVGGGVQASFVCSPSSAHQPIPPPPPHPPSQAFDRHFNMVLENVKEMWTEAPKSGKGTKRGARINRERFTPKSFLRGDSVIMVLRNPT